jgi:dTDP-4-amino-4,6-dideoxygalactose transaminase
MRQIIFNNLQRQNIQFKSQFKRALNGVLKKGNLILADEVARFEKEFAKYVGVMHGIGVASGTDAIILALLALDLKPTDEVAIPVNVYPVAFAVAAAGFKVKLIDIEPEALNLDVADLAKKATSRTKVVILVHLFGRAGRIKEAMALAKKRKMILIEDCSQAHGTKYHGKTVGSFGRISCFSFYPTKNLGALGDGGIVVTNDKKLAAKIRALRQYGEITRYESELMGRVSRLDEIQAAFLRVKLKKLNQDLNKRIAKAKLYQKNLASVKEIELPSFKKKWEHTFHLYVIKAANRKGLQTHLTKLGIQTGIHYPHLINRVKPFHYLKNLDKDFPVATKVNQEILSLPFYPNIPAKDIRFVCQAIKQFYQQKT